MNRFYNKQKENLADSMINTYENITTLVDTGTPQTLTYDPAKAARLYVKYNGLDIGPTSSITNLKGLLAYKLLQEIVLSLRGLNPLRYALQYPSEKTLQQITYRAQRAGIDEQTLQQKTGYLKLLNNGGAEKMTKAIGAIR